MKQFIAHGFLRDKSSQNPIPGLRVEAWDKDLIFNDLVGSTHSDARGYFKMVFDRSYFRELFLDRFPDIYFRIFQGNRLIKDTKDSILWNTGKSEGGAFLEIEIDASRLDPFDSDTRFGETPSTRAIYQATYTPRKATKREQEQAANNARGVEKGAFIASLNVRENELEALKDRLAAPSGKGRNKPPEDAKLARAIQIISGAINQGTKDRFLWQAGPISTIGVQTLQKFAGLLLDYREELLNEVAGAQEKILKKQNRAVLRTAGKRKEAPVTERNALAIWSKGGKNTVADKGRQLAGILKLDPRRISPAQFVATARAKLQQQREYTGGLRGILEKEPVGYLHLEKMSFTPAGIERGELVYSLPMAPTEEVNITHKEWSHTEEEFERIVTDYMEAYSEEGVAEKSEFAQAVNSQSQHTSAFNVGVTASGSYAGFKISTSSGYNASESSSKSQQSSRNQAYEITQKAASRTKKEHKISFRVASASEIEDETVRRIKNPFQDKPLRIDYYQLIRKWQVNLFREGIRLTWDMAIPEPGSGLLGKIREIEDIYQQLNTEFDLEKIMGMRAEDISLDPESVDPQGNSLFYGDLALKHGITLTEHPSPLRDTLYITFDKDCTDQFGTTRCKGGWVSDPIYEVLTQEIPEEYRVADEKTKITITQRWRSKGGKCDHYLFSLLDELFGRRLYEMRGGKHNEYNTSPGAGWERDECEECDGWVYRMDEYDKWKGFHGTLGVIVKIWNLAFVGFTIEIPIVLKPSVEQEWKQKVWNQMYEFKKAEYYENRQKLKDRLAQLEEELGEQDALSLRKKEREEVMKGILRWIGIENFEFFPEIPSKLGGGGQEELNIETLYDPETGLLDITEAERMDILRQGEVIKFLHQSIEWENMLYFLYPYFWTHPTRWEFKKYLNHPDPLHQAFLKAGSARVILTIRPGFEDAFLSFINKGPNSISELPPHPYLSIGEEFKNHAKTNFPGIPAANPITNYRPLLHPKQQQAWQDMQHIMKLLEEYRKRPLPEQRQAWRDLKGIMECLEDYRTEHGAYPDTQPSWEDFRNLFTDPIPEKDPWNNEYHYEAVTHVNPEDNSTEIVDYKLASWGADGAEGGVGANEDITSWAAPTGGEYPQSLNQLKNSYAGEEEVPLQDPWGSYYQYNCPGENGDYDLVSYGANGMRGGEGIDADITNWAEASLIGQWFEYTPTSAMDIAVDN